MKTVTEAIMTILLTSTTTAKDIQKIHTTTIFILYVRNKLSVNTKNKFGIFFKTMNDILACVAVQDDDFNVTE